MTTPTCPLCRSTHPTPLHADLCRVRLAIINLRLEEREIKRAIEEAELQAAGEVKVSSIVAALFMMALPLV